MNALSIQAPSAVVMIRPHRFSPNPETAADNAFQRNATADRESGQQRLAEAARDEVTAAAHALSHAGVRVHLFDDFGESETPDSVFPNNWFSTHPGGHVALYPMHCPNRRRERRTDIIAPLLKPATRPDVCHSRQTATRSSPAHGHATSASHSMTSILA